MPTLAEIRQQLPELDGLDDERAVGVLHQVYYPDMEIGQVAKAVGYTPPKPVDTRSDVGRGFGTAFKQLPQLGYGLMAGAGAAAESVVGEGGIATGIKKAGVKGYTEWSDKIAADSKESDSWTYSYDQAKEGNFGALVDWLQYSLGYVGGQALQTLATAGIGAVGGKLIVGEAAKQIAKGTVMKEAAALAATEEGKKLTREALISQATRNVASKIGQTAAVGASAVGMEGGEIFGDLVAEADKEGRSLTGAELGKAFGATLAAGGLEFVGDKLGLDIMLGRSALLKPAAGAAGLKGRAARAGIAAAGAAPIEGGTEYLQTGLEQYGKGKEESALPFMQSAAAQRDALDATMMGAFGGAVVGSGGGALKGQELPPTLEPPPARLNLSEAQQQRADAGLQAIEQARTVDEVVSAAQAAIDVPLVSPQAENRAMTAMERMAEQDGQAIRFGSPGFVTPQVASRAPTQDGGEGSATLIDAPFGDRVLTLREQMADPRVREQLRAMGPNVLDTVGYYASVADRADIDLPEKTRERLLTLAESIVSRAVLKPIEPKAQDPLQIGMTAPQPQEQRVGAGPGTPTGRMVVDSEGNAQPETAAMRRAAMQAGAELTDRLATRAPRSERADAIELDPTGPNAVAQFVERMRGVNTPAARAFVGLFESGRISNEEIMRLMVPRDDAQSPDQRLASAAAQAPEVLPTDLVTADGFPYGTKSAATVRASKDGGSVIEVPGGYVVRQERPAEASRAEPAATPIAETPSLAERVDGMRRRPEAQAAPTAAADADLPTLKRAWSAAVEAGDVESARALNDRIVQAKRAPKTSEPLTAAPVAESQALAPSTALQEREALRVTFGGKTYPVGSIQEAQRKWIEFRDTTGAGVSELGNGVRITNQRGKFVARISYNGRAWSTEDDFSGDETGLLAEAPTLAGSDPTPASGEVDYFAELFGGADKLAQATARNEDATRAKKAAMGRIRLVLDEQERRAQAELDDWSSRVYKRNKTQVELRGDGPSNQASMSVGSINESRRRRAIEALQQELSAIGKLKDAVSTESGVERVLSNLEKLMGQAKNAATSGGWSSFGSVDDLFEYMLLDDLKFRGPGGKGNVTSNSLSKAVLSIMKQADTSPPVEGTTGASDEEGQRREGRRRQEVLTPAAPRPQEPQAEEPAARGATQTDAKAPLKPLAERVDALRATTQAEPSKPQTRAEPSREVIELRKREAVLKKLLDCMKA